MENIQNIWLNSIRDPTSEHLPLVWFLFPVQCTMCSALWSSRAMISRSLDSTVDRFPEFPFFARVLFTMHSRLNSNHFSLIRLDCCLEIPRIFVFFLQCLLLLLVIRLDSWSLPRICIVVRMSYWGPRRKQHVHKLTDNKSKKWPEYEQVEYSKSKNK